MKKENYLTKQELFWAGNFGDEYILRNQTAQLQASNVHFFSTSLRTAGAPRSCIEFGANIGMNLRALQLLYPNQTQHAIEINSNAAKELAEIIPASNIFAKSILTFESPEMWELVLIKGVLIHLDPNVLPSVYDKLYSAAKKYILIAEYYNPTPISIDYRGHSDVLYKRDFAGEMLDRYPTLQLQDYGFSYHRDLAFPQDDITWFLLRKQ